MDEGKEVYAYWQIDHLPVAVVCWIEVGGCRNVSVVVLKG